VVAAERLASVRGEDLHVMRVVHDAQDVAERVDHRGGDDYIPVDLANNRRIYLANNRRKLGTGR
jgi:hypothetical protein